MNSAYNLLIQKLDAFIRKYYRNQLIRGAIYATGITVLFYLVVTLLEHFAWFGTSARTVLFYAFIIINAVVITRLIIIPLLKMFHLGKVISHEQASQIIGDHFPNVKDKLLNTLQLKQLSNEINNDLVTATNKGCQHHIKFLVTKTFPLF